MFQATTEQFTFVGLLGYRLQWRPSIVQTSLVFSAIQSLICKLASLGAGVYLWYTYQRPADGYTGIAKGWSFAFWFVSIGLLITQIYGTYVVLIVAKSYRKRYMSKFNTQQSQFHSERTLNESENSIDKFDLESAAFSIRSSSPVSFMTALPPARS